MVGAGFNPAPTIPLPDEPVPDVTLTLLNVQRPDCPDYHTT
jgi:hypothetical protein